MQAVDPGQRVTFVQDNCSIHTAAVVTDWFQAHGDVIEVLPWPAKSPDLNPIENLWAAAVKSWDDVGFHGVRERNVDQLSEHVTQVWEHFRNGDLCRRLVESMPRRLAACIAANGFYTKY